MKVRAEAEGGGLFRYESAANMLEGGGKTPILNPMELEEIGWGFYTSNAGHFSSFILLTCADKLRIETCYQILVCFMI